MAGNDRDRNRNRGGGGGRGGGGTGVTDGGLYTGDTGEYGAQTDPNAYFNFLLSQQGITPESVPSDVWNYTQNQMFNNWYSGYTNALGQNKTLTLAQYSGRAARDAPNKKKHPNQYKRWVEGGGGNTAGVGQGLVNPVNVGEIAQGLFRDQAELNPQDFYATQLQRSGQMNTPGAAQGYDAFIKGDRFNDRYSQYQLQRQQDATGQGVNGAAPGGPPPLSSVVPTQDPLQWSIDHPGTPPPNKKQHPNQYQQWRSENARRQALGHTPSPAFGAPPIGAPGSAPTGLQASWYANQQSLDPQQRLQEDNAAFNILTPAQKAYKFGVQNPFDRGRVVNWS